MTDENPPEPQPEKPAPPIDPYDAAWYNNHVTQDSYHMMNAVFIVDTDLLNLAPSLRPYLAAIHQNTMDNILKKYSYDRRISRTYHKQLLSLIRGYLHDWEKGTGQAKMSNSMHASACAAISQAEWVAKHAEALAEKERAKQRAGNVEIVKAAAAT